MARGVGTGLTPEKREALLELIAGDPNITNSCRALSISRTVLYRELDADEEFSKAFREAREGGIKAAEDEAWRRAVQGTDEPVFHKGEVCGAIRKYSDTLLIFMLKAARPDVYRERIEHSGDPKRPVVINVTELDDAQLTQIAAQGLAAKPPSEDP